MSETNSSFNTNDSEALYLDNAAYSNSVKEILLSGSELEFNPSAFDMENEINGTESMNTLISYWHSVSDTTGSYRLLLQNSVDPALNKVQKSVNDTNLNVSLALALANISSVFPFANNILNNSQGAAFTTPSGLKSAKDYIDLYIDLYNESLKLTDGDPSNDADALARMNELLNNCIVVYDESGQKILAYDTYFIDFVIDRTPESDLIHQLFSDLKENMPSNNKIATFNRSEPIDYSLTISQHNAGYQLVLSANGAPHKNRINDQTVAYAATEETCDQFFYIGNDLNWDNIALWLKSDIIRDQSYEFVYFADVLQNMKNDGLDKLVDLGQIHTKTNTFYTSKVLSILADNFIALIHEEKALGDVLPDEYDFEYLETKAIAFSTIVSYLEQSNGIKTDVHFSSFEGTDIKTVIVKYTLEQLNISPTKNTEITFTFYPSSSDYALQNILNDNSIKSLYSNVLPIHSNQRNEKAINDLYMYARKYLAQKFVEIGSEIFASSEISYLLGYLFDEIDFAEYCGEKYNTSATSYLLANTLTLVSWQVHN